MKRVRAYTIWGSKWDGGCWIWSKRNRHCPIKESLLSINLVLISLVLQSQAKEGTNLSLPFSPVFIQNLKKKKKSQDFSMLEQYKWMQTSQMGIKIYTLYLHSQLGSKKNQSTNS